MSMMISAGRRLCGRDDGATPVLSVMTSKSAIRSADVSAFPRILVLVDDEDVRLRGDEHRIAGGVFVRMAIRMSSRCPSSRNAPDIRRSSSSSP